MNHLLLAGCLCSLSLSTVQCVGSAEPQSDQRYVLVIHGGAGVISRQKLTPEKEAACRTTRAR